MGCVSLKRLATSGGNSSGANEMDPVPLLTFLRLYSLVGFNN